MRKKLKEYIEENIFPMYSKNDKGHNLDHIEYVINRSMRFSKQVPNINYEMVYVIAVYHDIGHHIEQKNHEQVSANMLLNDQNLRSFFSEAELKIMSEAIYDHRASIKKDPRTIYGKIVSSADRTTDVVNTLKRIYDYRIKNYPDMPLEIIIEEGKKHIIDKFGENGYALTKMYFDDIEYKKFIKDITALISDPIKFRKAFFKANNLNCLDDREKLRMSLVNYIPINEQEECDKELMLEYFNTFEDIITRNNRFGHLTASAFVVNEEFNKTLLVQHNIYNGFIYPGWHADGDYDLLSVAIKEVLEETGLHVIPLENGNIFSIQILPVKGHIKRGQYVSTHTSLDFLYLVMAKNKDMDKIRILESENSKIKWCDLDDSYNDEAVDWIRPINKKIVEKVRRLKKDY